MNKIINAVVIACMVISFSSCNGKNKTEEKRKPNILFLAVDDLRPELGCYGSPIAVSPNLDKLAGDGLLFNRAYCQQSICGPSRCSLMSGGRPEAIGVTHNYTLLREGSPDIITLPQHFKENGYETVYCGKVFHGKDALDTLAWTRKAAKNAPEMKGLKKPVGFALEENMKSRAEDRKAMFAKYGEQAKYGLAMGPAYECADVPDVTYEDGYNTTLAIATLKDMLKKNPDKPFFLGLGMKKPHLNWVAPKKYWDMYNEDEIPMAENTEAPENGSPMGLHPSFELRVRSNIPKYGDLDPKLERKLKHAYLACVSYIDAQLGRMIDALDEAGVKDNTIIVLWGDHGWHLGDMGIWGKATTYEVAARVPMMIWTPDMLKKNRGEITDALVELVDIYPTLCDLAGLEKPSHLDGKSFAPLLEEPHQKWKKAVFTQFPNPALREWGAYPLRPGMRETYFLPLIEDVEEKIRAEFKEEWDRATFENDVMGYGMRTDRYRLIVWKDRKVPNEKPLFVELYDHKLDPNETKNIAPEQEELTNELLELFEKESRAVRAQVPLN
ncbi:sulfatase [Saccharicrinis aurantiacus]|uniref:sulfatase n=1 Tax=Saccharicrinis aurantiacus TaxID=1849719 RepID=UPI00094F4EF9|nr:sulfatase [Saccharicrinis aurantiacus]